jgi:hypothetical protein
LHGYVEAVRIAAGAGPLDVRALAGSGDATDLINALRKAAAFDKPFAEGQGDELIRLAKYLGNWEEE